MILRVVHELESGELTVETREFEEPFPMEEVLEVWGEVLSEGESLMGVVGASLSLSPEATGGDWWFRPEWWIWGKELAEVAFRKEMASALEDGRVVQRIFVWAQYIGMKEEWKRKLLWLLSGGLIWLGGSPSSDDDSPYPHHARCEPARVRNPMIDLYRQTPGSRWAPKPEENAEPIQGELEL